MITETEAYRGAEDKACHASKGRTSRTEVMFRKVARIYVYFVYGMYWMLNFVAGEENNPQAALIRGIERFNGPGKLTKAIGIDKSFYGEDLITSQTASGLRIWVLCRISKPDQESVLIMPGDPWKQKTLEILYL